MRSVIKLNLTGAAKVCVFSRHGFTLMEILVAIFIFSVVMTTLFLSHHTLESSSRAIARELSDHETARICLDRISADLGNLYVTLPPAYRPPVLERETNRFRFAGEREDCMGRSLFRLEFASFSHLPTGGGGMAGIAQITYYPAEGEGGTCVLKRSDRAFLARPDKVLSDDPVLCGNIQHLDVRFVDVDGDEHESWDSDSDDTGYSTPRAVKLFMTFGGEGGTRSFETMVTLPVARNRIGKES